MKFGIVTPLLDPRSFFRPCAVSLKSVRFSNDDDSLIHYVRESSRSRTTCADIAAEIGCDYAVRDDLGIYDAIGGGLDDACRDGADILGWLNADEQALPGAHAAVAETFRKHPSVGIVFGDYLMYDPTAAQVLSARREIPARLFYLLNGVNYLMSCSVFFRREVWLDTADLISHTTCSQTKSSTSPLFRGVNTRHPTLSWRYGVTGVNASLAPSASATSRLCAPRMAPRGTLWHTKRHRFYAQPKNSCAAVMAVGQSHQPFLTLTAPRAYSVAESAPHGGTTDAVFQPTAAGMPHTPFL